MVYKILVTGGAGYIGSHTIVKLLESDFKVVAIDNFCNSSPTVKERIIKITGKQFELIEADITDGSKLNNIFQKNKFDAVIHFAGLKAVGDSEENPLKYYENNVNGSLILLKNMFLNNVKTIVFSSSATVYEENGIGKFNEENKLNPKNVYGKTKLIVENLLNDLKKSNPNWRIASLRYFNPVGAHPSGLIGEDPIGIPNNLMPFIAQVAVGKREKLQVFGGDYSTPDGTGKRDYIHIEDLAEGHISALKYLIKENKPPNICINLGTGISTSVLELIRCYEKVSGKKINYQVVGKRLGDSQESFADPSAAKTLLGWEAKYDIEEMCRDSWRWQIKNPNGY